MDLSSLSVAELRRLQTKVETEIRRRSDTAKKDLLKRMQKLAAEHGMSLTDVIGGQEATEKAAPAPKKAAAKPAAKAYKLAIGGGLYLEVMPGGSKLWRWKYRIGGKENRYAMGSYPELSLKEAREETEAARKLVKQGVHPAQQSICRS